MSVTKLINYVLRGPSENKIYSQSEMAAALDVTETRLIGLLAQGIGMCYHAHPAATGEGYWFNQGAFDDNIKIWRCYRDGGHNYTPDEKYDYLPEGAKTCACGHTIFGGRR